MPKWSVAANLVSFNAAISAAEKAWPFAVSIHAGFFREDMSHAGSAMASCAPSSVDDDSKEGTTFGFSHRKADFLKQNE